MLRMQGAARAPTLVGTEDVATSPTARASVVFAFDVVSDIALTADAMAGTLFPRATIAFANQPAAHWGGFYTGATLGASLRFR